MEDGLVIQDKDYETVMRETAEPFLASRRREWKLPRDGGTFLSCARYEAEPARGAVVIAHGFTETAEKYHEIVYYFVRQGYRVYIADHCGHGYSYRLTEDLSLVHVDRYGRYVEDLLAVAETAGKENPGLPLFLYGHSMGGGVAAALLAERPEMFKKAVLSSPMIRPLTGNVPWGVAKLLAALLCRIGMAGSYVPGRHPFDGNEPFEDSPSVCRERFDFYQRKRDAEPLYQMTAPSCEWLHQAVLLNRDLMKTGWRNIRTPFLLFQAQDDTFVDNAQQDLFVEKVRSEGKTFAEKVFVPGTRHEIFNSGEAVLSGYWGRIFAFFGETDESTDS